MQWTGLWAMALALLPQPLAGVAPSSYAQDESERLRQRELLQERLREYAAVATALLARVAQVLAAIFALFASATMIYSVLYYLMIPSRLHEQEIFFDYGTHAALASPTGDAHTSQILTLPTARLNLLDTTHQWTASPLVPLPPAPSRVLVPGVKYDVLVELTMPESRVNKELGMFMLRSTLSSQHHGVLASSARSAIVKDAHALVQWSRAFAWLVPYVLRLSEPAQTLVVSVVNGFQESKAHPLTLVELELNHPALQIYSAKLTIIAQISGVRYLMYHWAVPTAVLMILNIAFVEALALLVLFAYSNMPPASAEGEGDSDLSLSSSQERTSESSKIDQGELFERHRSGGIPPVHVERAIKEEPLDRDEMADLLAARSSLLADEEDWKLRYGGEMMKGSGTIEESFESKTKAEFE